jgi:hypothetical protein
MGVILPKALDKLYPLIPRKLLLWAIPAVVAIVSLVVFFIATQVTILTALMACGVCLLLSAAATTGFIVQIKHRYYVRKYVVGIHGNIIWRAEVPITPYLAILDCLDMLEHIVRKKLFILGIKTEPISEPVFISLVPLGGVIYTNPEGGQKYVRGLQYGTWILLEALDPHAVVALAQHELAHYLIQQKYPHITAELHHSTMAEAGIL